MARASDSVQVLAGPIRGLFLAGQTTYPGYGVSGATMSGVLAAHRIAAVWGGR